MNTRLKFLWMALVLMVAVSGLVGCGGSSGGGNDDNEGVVTPGGAAEIIFLHHSTGGNIWDGGVPGWFEQNAPQHSITEQWFPAAVDGNYPYDYWNLWVNRSGQDLTLETLTASYKMIIFKHCFPVSEIEADTGNPDIASDAKRLENYYLQYNALKAKLREFPNNIFIVWTGAVELSSDIDEGMAQRTRTFFDWVRTSWDEPGDNIHIFDFYALETEGTLYMQPEHASGENDAHPNSAFAQEVAPVFCQRIVDVIEGRAD